MLKPFVPGTVDYNGVMAANYSAGRALSPRAAETWRIAVTPFVPQRRDLTILDLGAGTGRFSALFADSFTAHVIGLEPALGMRAGATRQPVPNGVTFVAGRAEHIPLRDASCDVTWMSQVFHHLVDRAACAREMRRVLRRDGRVLLRGAFADGADGFPTLLHFFPGIAPIFDHIPSVSEAVATLEASGFELQAHRRIEQQTANSLREFAERTRLRADTSLSLLSDDEFADGMAALDRAAADEAEPSPVMELLDLIVFRA